MNSKILGRIGEDAAYNYLSEHGLRIIQRNFTCKTGEIDIIAFEEDTLVFVEVKTRTNDKYGKPSEAVSVTKQKKLIKTALWFMSQKKLFDYMSRFDVIELTLNEASDSFNINHIRNAFEYTGKYGY